MDERAKTVVADIAVVGCGHVGLVVASCFATLGHRVTAIDVDAARVASIRSGVSPIYEPGLDALLRQALDSGRLEVVEGTPDALRAEFVFLAVGTPPSTGGASDLRAVRDAVTALAPVLRPDAVIVNKSTVPIGTGDLVAQMAKHFGAPGLAVVSNPEFLQEGTAIDNFMRPDRVVLGSSDARARERVAALFEPLGAPMVLTDLRTAEMIKYASNAFLATKVSFVNEMSSICEVVGADIAEVARGMGFDERIGRQYLRAGIGWGGSCFPKDVAALEHTASTFGAHPQLLRHVIEINREQRRRVLGKVREALGTLEGRRILVLGAAFKPHTDDIRESPALEVADLMQLAGAEVLVHDPHVRQEAVSAAFPSLALADDLLTAAAGADALVLATEWPEFVDLPLDDLAAVMRRRLIVDGRNVLDPATVRGAGFAYRCIGRPALEGDPPSTAPNWRDAEVDTDTLGVGTPVGRR
ncbi:MAG: UDP-glucose/GDP-mannose dehydrogenase family protein [Dehalococcoidia bacterium]|nr:UDP-glucose/GDP-mannose dehydrogenase family protein [Dehalococcoidia bacterium]